MKKEIKIKNKITSYVIWGDVEKTLNKLVKKEFIIFDDKASPSFVNEFKYKMPVLEKHKSIDLFEKIINFLYKNKADRTTTVVCAGGGSLSDVCGFACAVWMRGIDFVIIPTTFLSQIDASVGGKTAADFRGIRNMIGCFHFPKFILIDPNLTLTQSYQDYMQAFGEIFKYIIITDRKTSTKILNLIDGVIKRDIDKMYECSKICVDFKIKIVEKDPFDRSGIREVLNFGHTLAHAIEPLLGIPHGDAVLAGCVFELLLSVKLGYVNKKDIINYLKILNYRNLPENLIKINFKKLMKVIAYDKKNLSNKNSFLILTDNGIKKISNVSEKILYEVWRELCEKKFL